MNSLNSSSLESTTMREVNQKEQLDGVPIYLFVVMCSFAFLGVVYAITIMIFNICNQRDKIIKMTSPNVNVVILGASVLAYGCIALIGFDGSRVSLEILQKLLQATAYILPISFSLIYGSAFAKSWRVYMIFKNINFNGKTTRDEHLLLVVFLLIVIDLVILLPWTFLDPIICSRKLLTTTYEIQTNTNILHYMDYCTSKYQPVWICLIYAYKFSLTVAGSYIVRQTRHVTLPSLKDTKQFYIIVYTLIMLSIVALPLLLTSHAGAQVRYGVGSLIILFVITVTITLLFIPKVILVRKQRKSGKSSSESMRFMFTESMKKTQENLTKCNFCCFGDREDDDKYVHEVLYTEIETLKNTIKEKDTTIRELNDRLYYGAEKFQEYLTTPKRYQSSSVDNLDRKYKIRKTLSYPDDVRDYQVSPNEIFYSESQQDVRQNEMSYVESVGSTRQLCGQSMEPEGYVVETGNQQRIPTISYNERENFQKVMVHHPFYDEKQERSKSPNHDSAIDNNSPSPTSSDHGSIAEPMTSQPRTHKEMKSPHVETHPNPYAAHASPCIYHKQRSLDNPNYTPEHGQRTGVYPSHHERSVNKNSYGKVQRWIGEQSGIHNKNYSPKYPSDSPYSENIPPEHLQGDSRV